MFELVLRPFDRLFEKLTGRGKPESVVPPASEQADSGEEVTVSVSLQDLPGKDSGKPGHSVRFVWEDKDRSLDEFLRSLEDNDGAKELKKHPLVKDRSRLGELIRASRTETEKARKLKEKPEPKQNDTGRNRKRNRRAESSKPPEEQIETREYGELGRFVREVGDLLKKCRICESDDGSCFVAGTLVHTTEGLAEIQTIRAGQCRVVTFGPDEAGMFGARPPVESAGDRLVSLTLTKPSGGEVRVQLLRSEQWLEEHEACVGGTVFLNMPEMGVEGEALVTAIEPCTPTAMGSGCLVTGTFRHVSGRVYDLAFAGEPDPLGVTATHPFWSVDRGGWVAAAELGIGERVKTLEAVTTVAARALRAEPEPVYNLEVAGDHVYRAGESGLLVHNASALQLARSEARDVNEALESIGDEERIDTAKAAAAIHVPTGKTAVGASTTGGPPETPHPLIQAGLGRVTVIEQQIGGELCNLQAGVCAEVHAVNNLLRQLGRDASLCEIDVATVRVRDGSPVAACQNCRVILEGVKFLTG